VGSIIVETQEWYLNASVERSSTQLSGCYPLSIFLRYGTCHNPKTIKRKCLVLQEEIKNNIEHHDINNVINNSHLALNCKYGMA
jgi:hypothetical protein